MPLNTNFLLFSILSVYVFIFRLKTKRFLAKFLSCFSKFSAFFFKFSYFLWCFWCCFVFPFSCVSNSKMFLQPRPSWFLFHWMYCVPFWTFVTYFVCSFLFCFCFVLCVCPNFLLSRLVTCVCLYIFFPRFSFFIRETQTNSEKHSAQIPTLTLTRWTKPRILSLKELQIGPVKLQSQVRPLN